MRAILKIVLLASIIIAACGTASAQKKKVHGVGRYVLGYNDTPAKATQESINRARVAAIKEAFGETVTSNTNMMDANLNGEEISNFVEETSVMSRAEWLGDTKETKLRQENTPDGHIVFIAEVWGEARRIKQAKVDFAWKVQKGGPTGRVESSSFKNRERIYITFKSPVDGWLAIYLLDSTNKEANCLLPYKTNVSKKQHIDSGKEYVFFDRGTDPKAIGYRLTTKAPSEMDQIVMIFSPNPFYIYEPEIKGDRLHPNSLSLHDFEKWLRTLAKQDNDIVIDRSKYVLIDNTDTSSN